MKNTLYLAVLLLSLTQCEDRVDKADVMPVGEVKMASPLTKKIVLLPGCYEYRGNGSTITFRIEEAEGPVLGMLTYELAGKDRNSGTFDGNLKGDTLTGTYNFLSEGSPGSREVAFLVQGNRLIEGYGERSPDGLTFKDVKDLSFSSTMPLTKIECVPVKDTCTYTNGRSYSKLSGGCIVLAELAIRLNPLKDGSGTEGDSAYLLFNEDRSQAELFLPNYKAIPVLNEISKGNWGNGEYTLISWKGYVVQKGGIPVYGG